MYRCNNCRTEIENPHRIYDRDHTLFKACPVCESEYITESRYKCGLCGKALYEGDRAFEAGDMIMCAECVTEVLI